MAEVFVKGVDGYVYLNGNTQARITNWSMSMDAPAEDVTDFGSDGQEYEYTGLSNFSGSVTWEMLRGTSVGGTTQEIADLMTDQFAAGGTLAKSTIRFIESNLSKWSGTVLFTNIGKDAPAQGIQKVNANWVSNGRLAWSSAT